MLAEHGTQCGLRELARGDLVVLHLDDGFVGLDHPVVDDGVHLDRDVVTRDQILGRHVVDHGPQAHPDHLLNDRHDDDEPGALHTPEASELEDHGALVLAQDADRIHKEAGDQDGDHEDGQ